MEARSERHADVVGFVLFGIPPVVAALRYAGAPVDVLLGVAVFLALTVLVDAGRWNLPRVLWVALMLLWPVTLPAYGFVRRSRGARAHWVLGVLSVLAWYALFGPMLQQGRAF